MASALLQLKTKLDMDACIMLQMSPSEKVRKNEQNWKESTPKQITGWGWWTLAV